MNCLGGSTQRMFLEHSKGISYYGTYKCHPVPGVTVCPRDRKKVCIIFTTSLAQIELTPDMLPSLLALS